MKIWNCNSDEDISRKNNRYDKKNNCKKPKNYNKFLEKAYDDESISKNFYYNSIKNDSVEKNTTNEDKLTLRLILKIQQEILKYIENHQ